jgi:hypothetical protein
VRYAVPVDPKQGPFRVRAELWLQPVGYRWAYNLAAYRAAEPQRFVGYYRALAPVSAVLLASAER